MSFYHGFITLILIIVSISQYMIQDNWQAAMYFLVGAGFYALWSVHASPGTAYNNCVVNFFANNKSDDKEKNQ